MAAYKYTDLLLDSLQGFVVGLTFCYRNGEVSPHTETLRDSNVLCSNLNLVLDVRLMLFVLLRS